MTALSVMLVGVVVIPVGWLLLRMARFSAPVSAAVGVLIVFVAVHVGSLRALGFGVGLFAFSTLLFVIGGGAHGILGR